MSLQSPLYAGTAITSTATFAVPGGAITDPTTVILKFKIGAGSTQTWQYLGAGNITRISTGVYSAEIPTDTTYGSPGTCTVEWVGSGACAALGASLFVTLQPPI
jgi:hypothetical protein